MMKSRFTGVFDDRTRSAEVSRLDVHPPARPAVIEIPVFRKSRLFMDAIIILLVGNFGQKFKT
jgi:hypothetical protein